MKIISAALATSLGEYLSDTQRIKRNGKGAKNIGVEMLKGIPKEIDQYPHYCVILIKVSTKLQTSIIKGCLQLR
jgi:hypothetical protein